MILTDEQQIIVSAVGQSFRIIAGAGSGKTTTLTLFVKATIDAHIAKDTEIVFITFTRLAAHDILTKVSKLIPRSNIHCGTFHKIMFKFIAASGISLPDPINLYDGCMERNVEFVLQQMRDRKESFVAHLRKFRLLVVDEFQDLDPHQFEFITLFRQINPTLQIIAIGDMAQNIYRFRGTSNEFLRRLLKDIVPDIETFYLRTNFRSTQSILKAVNTVFTEDIRNGHVQPMIYGSAEIGPKPRYYEANTTVGTGQYESFIVDVLAPVIYTAKQSGKSVALLFPVIKCQSYEIVLALLTSRFGGKIDFHRIAKEDATSAIVEFSYDPRKREAPVQLSTFHASKGLEWDIVALINVNDDLYRLREGEVDDEGFYTERTNLLYVGMTRPREELYIFGKGPRHRLFTDISDIMEITMWGEPVPPSCPSPSRGQSTVTNLVKKLSSSTNPDLFKRMVACSEHIRSYFHHGVRMDDEVYREMKKRNRELEFGTFIDWMIKKELSDTPSVQDRLLEILATMNNTWIHKDNAKHSHDILGHVIRDIFESAGMMPNTDIMAYVRPTRHIAAAGASKHNMIPELAVLYSAAEKQIMSIFKKSDYNMRDMYVLSHALNLYAHRQLNAIRAIEAPVNSYMGLPSGFDEFAAASVAPAAAIIKAASSETEFTADVSVETESLIVGEIDLITTDKSCVIEIKCSAEVDQEGLRGTASCTNLLQLLCYVAMGRHGVFPIKPRWGILVNPLTATWERYDMDTWTYEQSSEFLTCLEELRARG